MNKRKGFTLIELMVVITIIAILFSILLPNMVKAKYQAQYSACIFNERSLATALENYRTDSGGQYPPNLDPITERRYINIEPRCPSNSERYAYTVNDNKNNYTIHCQGWHWKVLSHVQEGFPQYNPAIGTKEKL